MLSLTKFKEWLFPTPPPMNYTSWAEYNDFCNNYTKFCTLQDNKLKDCFALNLSNNTKLNEKVIGGLSWVDYFIGLTFVVAQRSKDSQTKHGCTFALDEEAKKAITEMNGKDIEGRELKVTEARPMEERPPRRDFDNRRSRY